MHVQVRKCSGISLTQLSCGVSHSLAVTSGEQVYEWGCTHTGRDALRAIHAPRLVPVLCGRQAVSLYVSVRHLRAYDCQPTKKHYLT